MAWRSSADDVSAIGAFITELDTYLVVNAHWSVYDASAGTNEKVYRCLDASNDPPIEFYIHVQDNQVNFARIDMYDSWDAIGHTHDGAMSLTYGSNSSYYPYISKRTSGYYLSVLDHRFIWVDKLEWQANYIGCLKPFSSQHKMQRQVPVLITSSTGYNLGYNPMSYSSEGSNVVWRALMGSNGGMAVRVNYTAGSACFWQTSDGFAMFRPILVWDDNTDLVLGVMENVMSMWSIAGWNNDDYMTISAQNYRYVEGTSGTRYACLIKEE